MTGGVPLIEYRRDGRVGYIAFNRPDKLNAFTDQMLWDFHDALIRLDEDDDAWIGIISGNGRAFSSGADVQSRQMRPASEVGRFGGTGGWRSYFPDYFFRLTNWKPLVAAVHGHVLGMGLRISLLCEFIIAAEGTRFCITETGRGLDPSALWAHLDRRCRPGFALDVALTGRTWTAEEAFEVGAVDRLVPATDLSEQADKLAEQLAAAAPLSVRAVVEARRAALEELEHRARLTRARGVHLTEDFREALAAFAEKRPPDFTGK
jgi:enoyl-CoA hydratase/carnithine racemase